MQKFGSMHCIGNVKGEVLTFSTVFGDFPNVHDYPTLEVTFDKI